MQIATDGQPQIHDGVGRRQRCAGRGTAPSPGWPSGIHGRARGALVQMGAARAHQLSPGPAPTRPDMDLAADQRRPDPVPGQGGDAAEHSSGLDGAHHSRVDVRRRVPTPSQAPHRAVVDAVPDHTLRRTRPRQGANAQHPADRLASGRPGEHLECTDRRHGAHDSRTRTIPARPVENSGGPPPADSALRDAAPAPNRTHTTPPVHNRRHPPPTAHEDEKTRRNGPGLSRGTRRALPWPPARPCPRRAR